MVELGILTIYVVEGELGTTSIRISGQANIDGKST